MKKVMLGVKNIITIIFLIFPFIIPTRDSLQTIFGERIGYYIEVGILLWMYAAVGIIFMVYIKDIIAGRIQNSKLIYLIWAIVICLSISTIRMGGSFYLVRHVFPQLLAFFCLVEIYKRDDYIPFLKAVFYYLTFIMSINSLSMFLTYPNGLGTDELGTNHNYYLYGLDNVSFMYSFHALMLGDVIRYLEKKKTSLISYIPFVFILSAYFYTRAGTAMAITGAYIVIRIFPKKILTFISYSKTLLFMIISFIMIVIINSLSIFSFVLDWIGKNSTFTGRKYIWLSAINAWTKQWLWGYGTSGDTISVTLAEYGRDWFHHIGHLHNIVLEFLFKGGIICGVLFVLTFLLCWKNMKDYSFSYLSKILCIQLILSWLICMFEFRIEVFSFWIIPILMYNIPKLVQNKE